MREKLFIFLALIFIVVLLVGLNAASYVQKDEKPDDESYPNRSTYHAGATGTRAFYDLLAETGRKPARWREPVSALLTDSENKPQTFVVVGALRRDFEDEEIEQLLQWVMLGGKLVVIDRTPHRDLISTTANWQVSAVPSGASAFGIDPFDQQQMTRTVAAAKPLQPTIFTGNVVAVQPSRFAAAINLNKLSPDKANNPNGISPQSTPYASDDEYEEETNEADEPPLKAPTTGTGQGQGIGKGQSLPTPTPSVVTDDPDAAEPNAEIEAQLAPVVHVSNREKNLLADFPYGSGQIVFLSDPFIVSNAGISMVDNAQLAINIVALREGTIAFDEYHQGFGSNENRMLAYFADTPVPAIFAQIVLLAAAIMFTQSRRFARPLPAAETNRLSKLEYVSAMAELQQRTKAFDLAIENIYVDFRRRAAKALGADNFLVSRRELAQMIGERAKLNAADVENLMQRCENIIQGETTNKREVLDITSRLREIEGKIGLKRTRKQAFRK